MPEGETPPSTAPGSVGRPLATPPPPRPAPARKVEAWPLGCALGLLNAAIGAVLFFALGSDPNALILLAAVVIVELIAGPVLIRAGDRRVGKALLFAVAFTIVPVAVVGTLLAICYSMVPDW
jgi:hypothetical protein